MDLLICLRRWIWDIKFVHPFHLIAFSYSCASHYKQLLVIEQYSLLLHVFYTKLWFVSIAFSYVILSLFQIGNFNCYFDEPRNNCKRCSSITPRRSKRSLCLQHTCCFQVSLYSLRTELSYLILERAKSANLIFLNEEFYYRGASMVFISLSPHAWSFAIYFYFCFNGDLDIWQNQQYLSQDNTWITCWVVQQLYILCSHIFLVF